MTTALSINDDWLRFCVNNQADFYKTGAWHRLKNDFKQSGATKTKYLPYPLLIDKKEIEQLSKALKILLQAQTDILRQLVIDKSNAELLSLFNLPQKLSHFINWESLIDMRDLITRADIVPSKDGLKFCELNFGSVVGGTEDIEYFRSYSRDIGLAVEQNNNPLDDITDLIMSNVIENNLNKIVILLSSNIRETGHSSFIKLISKLRNQACELKVEIEVEYHDECSYPTTYLQPEVGRNILVYRVFSAEELIVCEDFYQSLWASHSIIINTFETDIRMSKVWFRLFHDSSYHSLLSDQQVNTIKQYIPLTFELTIQKLKIALINKNKYVFKQANLSGGRGILIGKETNIQDLKTQLLDKSQDSWLVQELIDGGELEIPYNFSSELTNSYLVFGLYLVKERTSGLMVRATSQSLLVGVSASDAYCGWLNPIDHNDYPNIKNNILNLHSVDIT